MTFSVLALQEDGFLWYANLCQWLNDLDKKKHRQCSEKNIYFVLIMVYVCKNKTK